LELSIISFFLVLFPFGFTSPYDVYLLAFPNCASMSSMCFFKNSFSTLSFATSLSLAVPFLPYFSYYSYFYNLEFSSLKLDVEI
jgi:hypothetical protein